MLGTVAHVHMSIGYLVRVNPIPTGLGHVTLIYGPIPPMAGRNRVNTNSKTAPQYDYRIYYVRNVLLFTP